MNWQPIIELDTSEFQFVLVYQDGAMRLRVWNPKGIWECSDIFGQPVTHMNECSNPTHFMPLPEPPEAH